MSEEEVSEDGRVIGFRLESRECLQEAKRCIFMSLGDEAQTQVHGIWKDMKEDIWPQNYFAWLSVMFTDKNRVPIQFRSKYLISFQSILNAKQQSSL